MKNKGITFGSRIVAYSGAYGRVTGMVSSLHLDYKGMFIMKPDVPVKNLDTGKLHETVRVHYNQCRKLRKKIKRSYWLALHLCKDELGYDRCHVQAFYSEDEANKYCESPGIGFLECFEVREVKSRISE